MPVPSRRPPAPAAPELARFPGYTDAQAIEVVDGPITAQALLAGFVHENRPCKLRGAIISWPACQRWMDPAYLLAHFGHIAVDVKSGSQAEPLWQVGVGGKATEKRALKHNQRITENRARLADVLPKLAGSASVITATIHSDREGSALHHDLGWLPVPAARQPERQRLYPRWYPRWSAVFYRNSYSDWHYHPLAEAIMCQIAGRKEVLLLPPDRRTWRVLAPALARHVSGAEVRWDSIPGAASLRPYRVLMEPGDALFIPVYWWHAVQAIDREPGVTMPRWWPSPWSIAGDIRFSALRRLLVAAAVREPSALGRLAPLALLGTLAAVSKQLRATAFPSWTEDPERHGSTG